MLQWARYVRGTLTYYVVFLALDHAYFHFLFNCDFQLRQNIGIVDTTIND